MNIDEGGHGSWICFFLEEVRDLFVDMLQCEMSKKLKDQWEFSCAGLHNVYLLSQELHRLEQIRVTSLDATVTFLW